MYRVFCFVEILTIFALQYNLLQTYYVKAFGFFLTHEN